MAVNDHCSAGCQKSLVELNSPTTQTDNNTIPIMLTCKGDCDFYIGSGVYKDPDTKTFECIQTPVFRISKIVDEKKGCCVELELLQPQTECGTVPPSCQSGSL